MDIDKSEFSKFVRIFKQMIKDLQLKCELIKETIRPYDNKGEFTTNTYFLNTIGEDYYFNIENLTEGQLISYSMTITYLMLRNHQYITTAYLSKIFPSFNKKTMFNLINKLKEIIPGKIDKNELLSYIIELD